jgi:NAD(P)-dependent dehydrogenase (short-subunit alcohol dehydrogenase family)
MSLQGKVVVITGASAGIGRATAREMARRGAHVGLIARGPERPRPPRREVQEMGVRACVAPADVADPDQVERAAAQIESELGPIDVWVNNAMAAKLAPVSDTGPEEFQRVTEVTYLGSVYGAQAALRRMRPRNRGVIVQVGSALSRRGIPLQASYCAAKHALKGFMDSLRVELMHDKSDVRVTLVQLPGLNTPQFGWVRTDLRNHPQPVPPIYQPEVAARAIAWAAEHPKRELWVGLPTVYTILGEKFASGLMDRFLARTNVKAQQTDTPIVPSHRDDNLQSPPPGDPGAHGRFDDKAKARSPQLWLATHKRALAGAAAGAAALGATALVGARR